MIIGSLISKSSSITVDSLFSFQAKYHGDRVALQDSERSCSYKELNGRAIQLGNALLSLNVNRGDRVAILSENRTEYVELQLAAAKIGAVVAAINWRLVESELEHCIALAAPKVIFVSERYRERLNSIKFQVKHRFLFGSEYESLVVSSDTTEIRGRSDPEDGLIILYTSGTTGLPKAALISHRAIVARGQVHRSDHGIERDDTFVAWAPLFHMVSTDQVLSALMHGNKVVVHDGFDANELAKIVGEERLGWLVLMPGMIDQFISAIHDLGIKPVGVRVVGSMADLVPAHQICEVTSLLKAPYMNTFGSTETGFGPASKGLIPIGVKPKSLSKIQSSYCDIRLVDSEGLEVDDGAPGELTIRGPSLFSGYWHAPADNAEDFRDGWFNMGDVFVRNVDGTLDFVDRRKYLIKSGGENIYPAEIERCLLRDSRVLDAVVVRKHDERWGEVPVAFVVSSDPEFSLQDVIECCEGELARYKIPKEVYFVQGSQLPRSATGKIKRHELEERIKRQPNPGSCPESEG